MAINALAFLVGRKWFGRALHRRYGDIAAVRLPAMGRAVLVSSPDLVKAVYTAKPGVLNGGESPLGALLGPGSLFSMDGDQHIKERRLLLQPFHGDRMRSYAELIEEEALRAFAEWPDDVEFSSLPTFNSVTLRVMLRAIFGAEGQELRELEQIIPPMTQLGQRITMLPALGKDLGRWSIGGRYLPLRSRYDEIVASLVDQHLADPDLDQRIDILAMMLRAIQAEGDEVNVGHVSDELMTLLVAGHETTASSLAWAVERLRRRPDLLKRLEQEVEEGGAELRLATINELQRVRTIIGGSERKVAKPFELGGYTLAPGTIILTNGVTMHDDERFHTRALEFDPDRYLGAQPDGYAWIPFGGGVRRCIGAAFAVMEIDVVLRLLLRDFELVPTTARGEREAFKGVAVAPGKGGRIVVRRR